MGRKPIFSPSKIAVFLACPVKYRWTYLDSEGKWYIRTKAAYSFGSTLHRVLQQFHDEGCKGVTNVEEALTAYEENWISAGYDSVEQAEEYHKKGIEIIQNYVGKASAAEPAATPLFIEKQLRSDMGRYILLGRLDRVDEYPDGKLEIIDYKSGRSNITVDSVKNELGMCIYQLLVKKHYPHREVCATLIGLNDSSSATWAMNSAEMSDFEMTINALVEQILDTDFMSILPTVKPICRQCDFLRLCKKEESFAEKFNAEEDESISSN